MILGASRETVRAEFLAVNPAVRLAFAPSVQRFLDAGGDPAIASAVIEARPHYLDVALDAMEERWGGLDGYVRSGLRLPEPVVDRLRQELTVPVGVPV